MDLALEALRVISIVAFLGYGVACVAGRSMVKEFERFGLARFRVLTGVLEVLGALGLLASYAIPDLLPLAAGGLALLMLLGVLTRIRVRDSLGAMLPAIVLMLANGALVAHAVAEAAPD
ncbi:MAG: DoxX family protein [Planctomycetota bacterium]